MSTRLWEPASLMNTDLSPRCRLTALRSSEGWSWQVTGNPISWQGAVKLTYDAQTGHWSARRCFRVSLFSLLTIRASGLRPPNVVRSKLFRRWNLITGKLRNHPCADSQNQ